MHLYRQIVLFNPWHFLIMSKLMETNDIEIFDQYEKEKKFCLFIYNK